MDNSHRMKYDNHTTCETSSPSLTVFLKVHAWLKLTFHRTPGRFHSSRLNIQPSPVKGRWLSTEDVAWSQKCSIMVNISFHQTKVETSGTKTNKTLSNFEFCIITGPHIESGLEGLRFLCRPSVQSNWEATSARRTIIWFRQSGHLFDWVWMLLVLVRSWVKTTTTTKKYWRAGQPRWRQALSESDSALLNLAVCEISQPASPLWRKGAFRGIKGDERLRI